MTDLYAIIGHPVAHSRSPEIHTSFAQETSQDMVYERLLAPLDGFRATLETFRAKGGRGANVTLPFKVEAFEWAQELTPRAKQARAVNTLKFDGSKIFGDNTDGIGLCKDIVDNFDVPIAGASILVFGAGGAARGVIGPLLAAHPKYLAITNRTPAKADEIAAQFANVGEIRAMRLGELASSSFDIVINATSASLTENMPLIPPSCFRRGALAYEMMYGKGQTPFMSLATRAGARATDGLGMLVEQAAEAFFIWRGVRPGTKKLLARMRSQTAGT